MSLSAFTAFGQTQTTTLAGKGDLAIKQITNEKDTLTYFGFIFSNARYETIIDKGMIMIYDKETATKFIQAVRDLTNIKDKVNVSLIVGEIELRRYEYSKHIYFIDDKGKFINLPPGISLKIVQFLEDNLYLIN